MPFFKIKAEYSLEKEQIDSWINILKNCKNFLKFDYKKHLRFSSVCTDFCVTNALSDENAAHGICNHDHVRNSSDCNALDFVLQKTEEDISKSLTDIQIKRETIFELKKCKKNF